MLETIQVLSYGLKDFLKCPEIYEALFKSITEKSEALTCYENKLFSEPFYLSRGVIGRK